MGKKYKYYVACNGVPYEHGTLREGDELDLRVKFELPPAAHVHSLDFETVYTVRVSLCTPEEESRQNEFGQLLEVMDGVEGGVREIEQTEDELLIAHQYDLILRECGLTSWTDWYMLKRDLRKEIEDSATFWDRMDERFAQKVQNDG